MNITQSDAELLARLSGGLDYNRKEDPTLDTNGRFKARVLAPNADGLRELVNRFNAPPDPVPPAPPGSDPSLPHAPYSFNFTATQATTSFRMNGPGRAGLAVNDGRLGYLSYSAMPDVFEEGSATGGNGGGQIMIPPGVWYINAKLGKDMEPCPANVYVNPIT